MTHRCDNCGIVPVEVNSTYCDLCVEEIVAFLEQEDSELKIWQEYTEFIEKKHEDILYGLNLSL